MKMIFPAGTEDFRNFADSPLDFSRLPLYCKNMGVENPGNKRQSDRQPVRFLKFSIADSLYLFGSAGPEQSGRGCLHVFDPRRPFLFLPSKSGKGQTQILTTRRL